MAVKSHGPKESSSLDASSGRDQFLQPAAVALVCAVLATLFFIMAAAGIHRMKRALLEVLEDKGINIIEGVEMVSREKFNQMMAPEGQGFSFSMNLAALETGFSVKESLVWALIDLVREIDRQEEKGALSGEALRETASARHVTEIAVLGEEGVHSILSRQLPENLLASVKAVLEGKRELAIDFSQGNVAQGVAGMVCLRRENRRGAILLVLDSEGLHYWGAKTAIQAAVEEIGWRKGLRYFVVTDSYGNFLAGAGETGMTESRADLFEAIAELRINDGFKGMAKVGLETDTVDPVLSENRRFIFLSMGLMIGMGLFAMFLLYKNQNRHLFRIQEMREKLHQAERLSSLGHLAAGVAHEIRNPLNAISMAIQRIRKEHLRTERETEMAGLLEVVREEIRRLDRIVEDFLCLSRKRFELRPRSLVQLLEEILPLIREEAETGNIQVEYRTGEKHDPLVRMDADKMKQALLNIMKNALESMSGQGRISISIDSRNTDHVVIVIRDTGSGISTDRLQHIFDPDYTTKDRGLGLGLSIAYEIVRAHSGDIRVKSEPGKGSTFEVVLPCSKESQPIGSSSSRSLGAP